jgi:ABC-2 type transport system permease protein
MRAALWAETVKLAGSTVGRVGTAAIVVGIAVLCAALLLAADSGDPQLVAKLGPAADGGWLGLFAAAAQVTGAGGLLGFGVVLAWMFGRELGEGTVAGLFALPVRRSTIAAAKLVVYGAWAAVASIALVLALLLVGTVSGLGAFPAELWPAVARQGALMVMTAAVAMPVAWAATVGRSLLVGVGTAIAIVVVAQVSVLAGAGGWMPLAAPALWAVSGGAAVALGQLLLLVPVVAVVAGATMFTWERLQLDR